MRLFFAILPDESARQAFVRTIERIKQCSKYGNFTKMENLHLTLLFLGQVSDPKTAIQAMKQIKNPAFSLEFNRLGKFKRDKGDIWWAGVRENPTLHALTHNLDRSLREKGFLLEKRPYKPHLTLGREVLFGTDEWRFPAFPAVCMRVPEIHLMKSEQIAGNLVYTSIAVQKLEQSEAY